MDTKSSSNTYGFIRVAAAVPQTRVADVNHNAHQITALAKNAAKKGASLIIFPELSITGYTAGDLFHQRILIRKALEGLEKIARQTKSLNAVIVVGFPLEHGQKLYNAAAVIARGAIAGIVPKSFIPNYQEFYEERWFASANDLKVQEIKINGVSVPIGTNLLFKLKSAPDAILGVEICEDLWMPVPPSSYHALAGATIIANLSASPELVAKEEYRKNLVLQQSARGVCGYVYVSAGVGESTTDLVYGGHALITENGALLFQSRRFSRTRELILADLDLEHLAADRKRMTTFENLDSDRIKEYRVVELPVAPKSSRKLLRNIDPHPFVPQNPTARDKRAQEIFYIQTAALAKRLENAKLKRAILGISGGLDSTLALLVCAAAFKMLRLPLKNIYAITMPGFATTARTKSNATALAQALGVTFEEIDITKTALAHFKDIAHNPKIQNRVFQNAQARYRTMILMNKANQLNALEVGTGDLSEIALGWNTFSGDHISHYNVNAGVPKTLVKYLVRWVADQKDFLSVKKVLENMLDTPISPELAGSAKGKITQKTEKLIGPYELHDFFLYHFVRWSSSPRKILFLAGRAFNKRYTQQELKKWLTVFIKRFFENQWKRSCMPDGPKVGSVALSPRGDWRMPSDAEVTLWLNDLKK